MPVYEYGCKRCGNVESVLVRRVESAPRTRACPACGAKGMQRIISGFAFHQSFQSKLEQLDPKYDKMIDAANPDLSFDNLVKKYQLDKPITKEGKSRRRSKG